MTFGAKLNIIQKSTKILEAMLAEEWTDMYEVMYAVELIVQTDMLGKAANDQANTTKRYERLALAQDAFYLQTRATKNRLQDKIIGLMDMTEYQSKMCQGIVDLTLDVEA